MNETTKFRIEEIILVVAVLLSITTFLTILPGDLDFVENLISITLFVYIFYQASITNILFGEKNRKIDFFIILSFTIMLMKDFVNYANSALSGTNFVKPLYQFFVDNSVKLEYYSLIVGIAMLIIVSFFIGARLKIKKPSFSDAIGLKNEQTAFVKSSATFFVLLTFFLLVFNMIIEWLGIAIDDPLLGIFAFFYFIIIIKRRNKTGEGVISDLGNFGNNFYQKFISSFQKRSTLFVGFAGLLVLHLLTDVGVFMIPYIIGLRDVFYFGSILPAGHTALVHLFAQDAAMVVLSQKILLFLIYLLNIFAMLFFLLAPAFIWYKVTKKEEIHAKDFYLPAIFVSLATFFLMPAFTIKRITAENIVGVDILTQSVLNGRNIDVIAFSLVLAGVVLYILESKNILKKDFFIIGVVVSMAFFAKYIYYYFMTSLNYYFLTVKLLFSANEYFLMMVMAVFGLITLLFYSLSFIIFIIEIIKNYKEKNIGFD